MIRQHVLSFVCAVLVASCGSGPKERFYVLGAVDTDQAPSTLATYSVVVGPVSLPETVDRPQIVLRAGPNRVELSEFDRWAEPLKKAIPRVIAANLAQQLGTSQVYAYSQAVSSAADYRVWVDVQRFELAPEQREVTLEALWSVQHGGQDNLKPGHSLIRETAGASGYEALVSAQERALARISQDIAESVRAMEQAR